MCLKVVKIVNPLYLTKGKYAFFADFNECESLLRSVYFSDSLVSLIEISDLSDTESFTKNPRLKDFNFATLVCSSLSFRYDREILSFLDWSRILECLINPYTSKKVFDFLKSNQFCKKENREKLLRGAEYFFQKRLQISSFPTGKEKTIFRLFQFFELDRLVVENLTNSVLSSKKSLKKKPRREYPRD